MKNLIVLFVVSLLASNAFAQMNVRNLSEIESTKTRNNTVEDVISTGKYPISECVADRVHFMKNEKLYMLALEPLNGKESSEFFGKRELYLYCRDNDDINNPWRIASDLVWTCNYKGGDNYTDVDFFLYDKDSHNTSVGVVEVDENNIKMTIGFYRMGSGKEIKSLTFTFIPEGKDFYKMK